MKSKNVTQNGNQIEKATSNKIDYQQNTNQKLNYQSSLQSNNSNLDQSLTSSSINNLSSNTSNSSSNNSLKMNGFHYNNHFTNNNNNHHYPHHHHNLDNTENNHHQFHHQTHNNSHHVHNSRMQPVLQTYPFIPGHHLNNGSMQDHHQTHPTQFKMPYYPQFTANSMNSSKPFYPTNPPPPNGYSNAVLTSISSIAAPSIANNNSSISNINNNGISPINEQQQHTNGQHQQQSTNVVTTVVSCSENYSHSTPYQVTYPATAANAANHSYMHHHHAPPPPQYISAHPNAHFTHHQPMFYVPFSSVPLSMPPQFYPQTHHPHYPTAHHIDMAQPHNSQLPPHNAQPTTILTNAPPQPHQQLATPPISPQQHDLNENENNLNSSSNCDTIESLNNQDEEEQQKQLIDNDKVEKEEEIKNDEEEEENKDQTILNNNNSNYGFLSPESMEERKEEDVIEIEKENELDNQDELDAINIQNNSSTNISSFSSVNELNTTNDELDEQQQEQLKIDNDVNEEKVNDNAAVVVIDNNKNVEVDNLNVELINLNNEVKAKEEDKNLKSIEEDNNDLKTDLVEEEETTTITAASANVANNKPAPPRSWADLFKSGKIDYTKPTKIIDVNLDHTSSAATAATTANLFNTDDFEPLGQQQIESIVKLTTTKLQQTIKSVSIEEDHIFPKLAKKLKDLNLKHSLPLLVPRGFINQSNWCYINSILQALLYCPPFYNLMREIGETANIFREKSATPVIDQFAKFFTNFMPNEHLMRKVKTSHQFGYDDLPKLDPYEPKCIYNVLGNINNECLKGKQEDAEEFLSSVLNSLHEEMLLLLNYDPKSGQQQNKQQQITNSKNKTELDNLTASAEDEKLNNQDNSKLVWKEVKTKHKTLALTNVSI